MDLQHALAEEIVKLRDRLHLTQAELASAVSITRTSISNIERGKQSLSLDLYFRIANALNQRPDAMLGNVIARMDGPWLTEEDISNRILLEQINKFLDVPALKIGGENEQAKN